MGVRQSSKPKRIGRKPKYDYTGEEFLSKISELAKKGYTDREIACSIGLNETYFYEKKAEYHEISEALTSARAQLNTVVRAAFLKSALGGRLVRTYKYIQKRCECKGQDPDCEICDGTGWITPEQHREVIESELPPNPLMQEHWLRNYDTDFRKRMKGEDDDSANDTVEGYDIKVTFNKKEDLELQEKVRQSE